MFSLLLVVYRLALFFYYAPIEKPATQATGFCLFGKKGTGGGALPYKRLMGCAAGWGRIFTTELAIMGSHFQ